MLGRGSGKTGVKRGKTEESEGHRVKIRERMGKPGTAGVLSYCLPLTPSVPPALLAGPPWAPWPYGIHRPSWTVGE